jgi:hypothetical protein
MISYAFLVTVTLAAMILKPGTGHVPKRTMLGDAIGWYQLWLAPAVTPAEKQTCRGMLDGGVWTLQCNPIGAVVSGEIGESGECTITNIHHRVFPAEGLTMYGFHGRPTTQPHQCPELPSRDGRFQVTLVPSRREYDEELTLSARDTAIASFRNQQFGQCRIYFPRVKRGDPFFHVYKACNGAVDEVYEFTIQDGRPATFAHWTYSATGKSIPRGGLSDCCAPICGLRAAMESVWIRDPSGPKEGACPTGARTRNREKRAQ